MLHLHDGGLRIRIVFFVWRDYRRMMKPWFGCAKNKITKKYNGKDDPHYHLEKWTKAWGTETWLEWVHIFFHTLDMIPMNWYMEMELPMAL